MVAVHLNLVLGRPSPFTLCLTLDYQAQDAFTEHLLYTHHSCLPRGIRWHANRCSTCP